MCSDVYGGWVDMWESDTFPEKQSVLPIANTDHGETECSTSGSLRHRAGCIT